jgi:hypothetical protein
MRYTVTEEVIKDGRKRLIQYCVFDFNQDKVIARYAKRADAELVISKWKANAFVEDEA